MKICKLIYREMPLILKLSFLPAKKIDLVVLIISISQLSLLVDLTYVIENII